MKGMDSRKCKICGKQYQPRTLKEGRYSLKVNMPVCTCEDEEYNRKKKEDEIETLMGMSNIPKMYRDEDMKDWVKIPGTEELTSNLRAYMSDMHNFMESGRGILVAGSVGTGKTKSMCYLLRQAIIKFGSPVLFQSSDMMSKKLSEFRDNSAELSSYVSSLATRKVLLLDDLGESEVSEWRKKHVSHIINERYYNSRPTFFTTMKTMSELEEIIGEHLMSRICQMCSGFLIEIKSDIDMRKDSNRREYGIQDKG
jgi:DNA replication protein DnaC